MDNENDALVAKLIDYIQRNEVGLRSDSTREALRLMRAAAIVIAFYTGGRNPFAALPEKSSPRSELSISTTEVNVLAQRFYEASNLHISMTDKRKVCEGLEAVFTNLGYTVVNSGGRS